jgi:hypothetical protein
MAACVSTVDQLPAPSQTVRVLRWTFRRGDESAWCELGLDNAESAYELRVMMRGGKRSESVEAFRNAIAAFERQTAIERRLVSQGWSLEAFQSDYRTR